MRKLPHIKWNIYHSAIILEVTYCHRAACVSLRGEERTLCVWFFPLPELCQTLLCLSQLWLQTLTPALGFLFPASPYLSDHCTGALGHCLTPCWTPANQNQSLLVALSPADCSQVGSAGDIRSLTIQPLEQCVLWGAGLVLWFLGFASEWELSQVDKEASSC